MSTPLESRAKKLSAKLDHSIAIRIVPGHFATNHSHVNFYVDLTNVKVQHKMAKKAGAILADRYRLTSIDTIICLEGTEMVGAFLADALTQAVHISINAGSSIHVLTPELNSNNQLIFRDNTQHMVTGKNVLLFVSTASTGKTINRALDCLQYYNGNLVGICTLFSAVRTMHGVNLESIFTENDISTYQSYLPGDCQMCARKEKIDAIANSFGYSKL